MRSLIDYPGYYRYCDRCGKKFPVEELIEDPVTPGIFVCPQCADEPGIEERMREDPINVPHYFR